MNQIIEQRHQIPLATAVAASTPGRMSLAENLYQEALSVFFSGQLTGKCPKVLKVRSVIKDGEAAGQVVLARIVDFETGLFIELSGTLNEAREAIRGPFLAYGQFYVSEGQNPQLANTQTKLWR
jgi:hypothetical protein